MVTLSPPHIIKYSFANCMETALPVKLTVAQTVKILVSFHVTKKFIFLAPVEISLSITYIYIHVYIYINK
jgi:hypothetical protein